MPIVCYQETIRQHAQRLRVTVSFAEKRRRALSAQLEGRPMPAAMPKPVWNASADDLMRTLAVAPQQSSESAGGEARIIKLIPALLPATEDLLAGQRVLQRRRPRLMAMAAACTNGLRLPYGYRRHPDGTILPDQTEAEVIRRAFTLIVALGTGEITALWQSVADRLNADGCCRGQGQSWRAADVRALTRITPYAGYVRRNDFGIGDAVERFPEITQPIVSLDLFVGAAEFGYGKGEPWLQLLKAILRHELI